MTIRIPWDAVPSADLIVDAVYESGPESNLSGEVISKLLPGMGNAAGFRYAGKAAETKLVVLFANASEPNWPDEIDVYRGLFRYFGDNRKPGRELHNTSKKGNQILARAFDAALGSDTERQDCPIFLIFESVGTRHDVIFRGLAIPGDPASPSGEDLVAVWRVSNGMRFQNYRATFTILDIAHIPGDWVRRVVREKQMNPDDISCPKPVRQWIKLGKRLPLIVKDDLEPRSREMQEPVSAIEQQMLKCILDVCQSDPFSFEPVAAQIWQMACKEPMELQLTQKYRDGGRDAIGSLNIGSSGERIPLDFALEAKLYSANNSVGVKEISRLISRLRHRQFGVLVTTSFVSAQAYKELRSDQHPVIVISGGDITRILRQNGIINATECKKWLTATLGERLMDRTVAGDVPG